MIGEDEARAKVLGQIRPLPGRRVALSEALDFFATEDYIARLPLPAFDNSAMDGYAVVASLSASGKRLRVVGEQPAGVDRQLRVGAGEAVRIFTGAPLPANADAVIMQEDVTREGDHVRVNTKIEVEDFIRRRGCDLSEGQKILSAGERMRPAVLGLLASQGFSEVMVGGEVDAAIISTGSELARPGQELEPGQIYESNSVLLQSLLHRCGVAVRSVETCPDVRDQLTEAIKRGLEHRVLIVSGGVSVGEHDFIREILLSLGAEIDIWRVAIKPGKPFLFGRARECLVFGLPGNPVSAFVTFLKFVRPAVLKMMGGSDANLDLRTTPAELSFDARNESERVHYVRGKFDRGIFTPVGRQESHALYGLSQSNALLRVAAGADVKRGTIVKVELWD